MLHLLCIELEGLLGDEQKAILGDGRDDGVAREGGGWHHDARGHFPREHPREEELELAEGTRRGERAVGGILNLAASKEATDGERRLLGSDGGVLWPQQLEPLGDSVLLLEHHRDDRATRQLVGEVGKEVDVALVPLVELGDLCA